MKVWWRRRQDFSHDSQLEVLAVDEIRQSLSLSFGFDLGRAGWRPRYAGSLSAERCVPRPKSTALMPLLDS